MRRRICLLFQERLATQIQSAYCSRRIRPKHPCTTTAAKPYSSPHLCGMGALCRSAASPNAYAGFSDPGVTLVSPGSTGEVAVSIS